MKSKQFSRKTIVKTRKKYILDQGFLIFYDSCIMKTVQFSQPMKRKTGHLYIGSKDVYNLKAKK